MQLPTTIEQSSQRVLTTAQLAEAYGTTEKRISENFIRNREHYIRGKHFYYLEGETLKDFLHSANCGLQNESKIRFLYLWTEKGALFHAKSLNTDKAWEVYEFLVDSYFRAKAQPEISGLSPMLQYLIQMEQRQNQLEQRQKELETMLETDRDELIKAVLTFERIGGYQRKEITKAVRSRAFDICHYAEVYDKMGKRVIDNIYAALQKKFEVESYLDLTMHQFTDAIIFIQCFEPDKKLQIDIYSAVSKPDMTFFNLFTSALSSHDDSEE